MAGLATLGWGWIVVIAAPVFAAIGYVAPAWLRRLDAAALETELMRHCHGDRELAERLLAAELARRPSLARGDAVVSVLAQLRRDRRR